MGCGASKDTGAAADPPKNEAKAQKPSENTPATEAKSTKPAPPSAKEPTPKPGPAPARAEPEPKPAAPEVTPAPAPEPEKPATKESKPQEPTTEEPKPDEPRSEEPEPVEEAPAEETPAPVEETPAPEEETPAPAPASPPAPSNVIDGDLGTMPRDPTTKATELVLRVAPVSMNNVSTLLAAGALGLIINIETINLMKGEQLAEGYKSKVPMHCTPSLEEKRTGFVMWESNAIVRYLCTRFEGGEKLLPIEANARALVDMQMDWFRSFLYNVTTVNLIYPELKFRPAPSPEAKEAAEKKLQEDLYPTLFHWIDKSGGPLLGGETANAADIMLGPWCRALQIVRPDLYEMGGEKLAKWWEAFVATVPMAEKTMSTLVEYATSCAAEKAGGGDAAAEE